MSEAKKEPAPIQLPLPGFDAARAHWRRDYADHVTGDDEIRNRSGIPVKPLYTPEDWDGEGYMAELGFPGQLPATRGIYPSMHRGRSWSQRQLVGLATPRHYNQRLRTLLEAGANAISLIPCNSVYRGYDVDEVDPELLGTCGSTLNTVDDMALCLDRLPIDRLSIGLNDPSPFTLLAFVLAHAKRIGVPWSALAGTSNQSDYISHFVANHMFFRLALPGARRLLLDEIEFMNRHVPRWNPISVVGQHMQQAGATPAEAMGLTLSTAIQYTGDCVARGMAADSFLPRLSFFFDISMSFFEEIAKFRAGRRVWARIVGERFGAQDPRSWRFKFHSQTSGVDLTREQPLNNVSRVAAQAMAGIFGGTQSLHTDAYDEVLSSPTEAAARIAVNTQNILREEAHLTDVIDPLGGSYYLETLTNRMEEEIVAVIARIDDAGGMFQAVESGLVQRMIGESALAFQRRVESGEQKVVGVNAYLTDDDEGAVEPLERPDPAEIEAQIESFKAFKRERDGDATGRALDALGAAANSEHENVFEQVVEAAMAGATNGEICTRLRAELGFGQPLVVA
jgi:methylmalonyl-CoA mutase N-terminal domain/subunit